MDTLNSMTGPEFLDALADQEAANGNDINAATYRERAGQWARDRRLIDSLALTVGNLTARLQHIAEHAHAATEPA